LYFGDISHKALPPHYEFPLVTLRLVSFLRTVTLSFVPTVIVCAAAVAVGMETTAVTLSPLADTAAPLADALEIPVATLITPVPAVAPVARDTVGWEVTFTPVKTVEVDCVPRPVIAEPEEPIVTPVTTADPVPAASVSPVATVTALPALATVLSDTVTAVTISLPLPLEATAPVAAVIAVPSVTLLALKAVPSVGAVLLAPEIINVSEAVPLPIAKLHVEAEPALVTFGMDTLEFPVTLGIDVVTNLLAVFVTFDTVQN
jgi:hypothetical protein